MNKNLRNVLSLFSMDLAMKFIGFLATAYLARILGKSGFGAISVGQSVLNYTLILATGGLNVLGTRKIAAGSDPNSITGQIFLGRFTLSTIIFLLTVSITFILLGFSESSYIIFGYVLFLIPSAFMLEWFFIGIQKMDNLAYTKIIGMAVYFLIVVLMIKERQDAVLTGIAWSGGGIITAGLFIYFYKSNGYSISLAKSGELILKTLKESFPLGMASYLSQFLIAFPVIYIAYISGNSEAGIFSAAFKMISLFLMFDRVFVTLFLPKVVNVITSKESSLEKIFNTVLKIIVFITLITSIFLFLFSGIIIDKTFGGEYAEAVFIFRLLLVYFIFTIVDSIFASTLIGLMKEKVYTISLSIALAAFLTSTFILTPFFGEYGVIYSFLLINIISLSYMVNNLRREIKIKIFRFIIFPLLFSASVLLLFVFFNIPLLFEIIFAIIIFIPLLILIIGINKDEINFIKRVFT